MTHRGPFQPLLFCDSERLAQGQQLGFRGPLNVAKRCLRCFRGAPALLGNSLATSSASAADLRHLPNL